MNNKKNQKGVILLLTLLILSGILVVTLGAASLVLAGIRMNRLTGYSNIAFFASETGLERALWEARKKDPKLVLPDDNFNDILQCDFVPNSCDLSNGSSYMVNYATSSPPLVPASIVTFTSTGSYQGVKRSVESSYQTE